MAAESGAVRAIRADLRGRWGLGRAQHHAIGYWRRGRAMVARPAETVATGSFTGSVQSAPQPCAGHASGHDDRIRTRDRRSRGRQFADRRTARTPEARLLVVDDEPNIRELLSASLRYAGFEVATAADGQQALALADSFRPDLLVLDVMMPGLDGFGVVRRLRQSGRHTPVLFLTARDAAEDKVSGLTLGGDDYVTKPFSLDEVLARIRAVLRRSAGAQQAAEAPRLTFADIELDEESHEVIKAGEVISLSPTEFKLLRYLMANAGRVLSKAQILDHVWNYDFNGEANVVESYISYLRRKIDTTEPRLLHTIRGVGYTLRLPRGT